MFQQYAGLSGKRVTVLASTDDAASDLLQRSWSEFSRCTGITVSYEGAPALTQELPKRIAAGTGPDMAVVSPGELAQLAPGGKLVEVPAQVATRVSTGWSAEWAKAGTVSGRLYAAPLAANLLSVVWYSPELFRQAKVRVPTTWEQLIAASNTIAETTKIKPWCEGLVTGSDTGSPAGEWLANVLLRQAGPQVYDRWVSHQLKFNSPQVRAALETLDKWLRNGTFVNGGIGSPMSIGTARMSSIPEAVLSGRCAMTMQTAAGGPDWPEETTFGPDGHVAAFLLPPIDQRWPEPLVVDASLVTAFSSRPEVVAFQDYLASPAGQSAMVEAGGGWMSASSAVAPSSYANSVDAAIAGYLTSQKATIRFNAADLMPAAIGSKAMPDQLVAFFGQNKPAEDVVHAIDAAWPPPK